MKLTPFNIFLILLIVLVISVIFGNSNGEVEGFISANYNYAPNANILIPQYNKDNNKLVTKLYDNIMFDQKNGNLIEVDSSPQGNLQLSGNMGSSITSLYIIKRDVNKDGIIYSSKVSGTALAEQNTPESMVNEVINSNKSGIYVSNSINTDKYSVFYIPWDKSTYVHIINNTTSTNVGTWFFQYAAGGGEKLYPANTSINLTSYNADTDPNNNMMVSESFYTNTRKVFQISKYVKFDITNANLIVQTDLASNKTITVYDRNNLSTRTTMVTPSTSATTTIDEVMFTPFIVNDLLGQHMILYMPIGQKTVVAVISYKNTDKKLYTLVNVCRFNKNGIVRNNNMKYRSNNMNNNYGNSNNNKKQYDKKQYDKNRKQYDKNRKPDVNGSKRDMQPNVFNYSDDYLLKTQIVPPVCPSCPSCPNCPACPAGAATCTNCGGKGGSGTLAADGKSAVGGKKIDTTGKNPTGSGKVVDATGNIISGAENVVGKTVGAAGNIIGGVATGAGNLAGKAIGETSSLIKGAGSGAVSLLRDTGSGIKDILTSGQKQTDSQQPNVNQRSSVYQQPNMGTQNQYNDPYSYSGQLTTKPSADFMPITTNFAAFGK